MEKVTKVNPEDSIKHTNKVSALPLSTQEIDAELSHINTPMPHKKENNKSKVIAWFAVVVILGIGTGYGASKATAQRSDLGTASTGTSELVQGGKDNESGVSESTAFPDTAQGVMKAGGIDGEGTHYLDRGLGKEKYVYLTSTVINLDSFIEKKVEVHGQTLAGKKAGWLMDVGRVKVLE